MQSRVSGRVVALGLALAVAQAVPGCAPSVGAGPANPAEGTAVPIRPVEVRHEAFASSVRRVLLEPPGKDRTNLLVGVVRHQLGRARDRFDSGNQEAGLRALTGAFYLTRSGELRPEMLEDAEGPLGTAAKELSRVGDEGRAYALYSMLEETLAKGRERSDVKDHMEALKAWANHKSQEGPLARQGAVQRALAARSLLDTRREPLEAATAATVQWILDAQRIDPSELNIKNHEAREEALEGYRAVRTGGPLLVALHLRHGSAEGALNALERADLFRFVPSSLRDRLERAGADRDPQAWADLFELYHELDDQMLQVPGMARAAAFGAALELYRAASTSGDGAFPLALLLIEHGMAEVAPFLMAPTLNDESSTDEVSRALAVTLQAIATEEAVGALDGARRAFANAKLIRDLAVKPRFKLRVRPSAAELTYAMGGLEARAGELGRARPLIEAALGEAPNVEGWASLAAIDRQRADYERAATLLGKVIAAAQKEQDVLLETETLAALFEIRRDQGHARQAQDTLQAALRRALDARRLVRSAPKQARAERVLARILEHYQLGEAARRATERAYKASRASTRELTATVLDASRRALTQGDLAGAREAVQQAIEAGLPDEDMVYVALWLYLLERKLGVSSDGTVEEALALVETSSGWPAQLRAWALGKLSDSALLEAAATTIERTEAEFYAAMAKHVRGSGAWPELARVAKSEAIELVEVTIARDLVAGQLHNFELRLGADIVLP